MKKIFLLVLIIFLAISTCLKSLAYAAASSSAASSGRAASASASASSDGASALATTNNVTSSTQAIIELPPENYYQKVIKYSSAAANVQTDLNPPLKFSQNPPSARIEQTEVDTASSSAPNLSTLESIASRVNDIQKRQEDLNGSLAGLESLTDKSQRHYLIGLALMFLLTSGLAVNSIKAQRKISPLEI